MKSFIKKNKKKLLLLSLICSCLLLSGCGRPDWPGDGLLEIGGQIQYHLYSFSTSPSFFVDYMYASIVELFNGVSTFKDIKSVLPLLGKYFDNLGELIGWFQVLALGYIAIQFGWSIVNDYILIQDNRLNVPVMHRLKRLFVSIIGVFVIPTLVISSYVGSTYLGLNFATSVAAQKSPTDEYDYAVYDRMKQFGVDYSTACAFTGGESTYPTPSKYSLSVMFEPNSDNYSTYNVPYLDAVGLTDQYGKLWESTCGKGASIQAPRVKEAMEHDADTRKIMFLSSHDPFEETAKGIFSNAPLMILFQVVINSIFVTIATWSIMKRTVDVVFLALMSWFYCGENIKNTQTSAFANLGKKLLSMCMTQFFVILEIGLYFRFSNISSYKGGGTSSLLFFFIMQFVWISFLLGTPTFIQEMLHDSGTAGDIGSGFKAAGKVYKHFKDRG